MARKTIESRSPGTKLRDASGDVSGRANQGARVTTPQPGVGRPSKAVTGPKVADTRPDFRDNDGDGSAAGPIADDAAMRSDTNGNW